MHDNHMFSNLNPLTFWFPDIELNFFQFQGHGQNAIEIAQHLIKLGAHEAHYVTIFHKAIEIESRECLSSDHVLLTLYNNYANPVRELYMAIFAWSSSHVGCIPVQFPSHWQLRLVSPAR